MTYDATDPDADGVVEADVDNQSVNTDEVQFGGDTVTKNATVGADYDDHANNGGYHSFNWGLRFETDRQVHITNVTIDANYTGDLAIELRPFNAGSGIGSVVDSDTATVEQGRQRLDIDITVPDQTQEWWLGRADASNTPLHRDNTSAVSYPYSAGPMTVLSGGNGADGSTNSTYFYFYDIGVEWEGEHTASMSQTGRAVDFDGSDIDNTGSVSANHVGVGGSVTYPDEWGANTTVSIADIANVDNYAKEFSYLFIIDPDETIHLGETQIDAETAGTVTFDVYPFISGQQSIGYNGPGSPQLTFDVDAGVQTIDLDLTLDPLPNEYDGYGICASNSSVGVGMISSYSMPQDIGPATINGGRASGGGQWDEYCFFFDLDVQYEHADRTYELPSPVSTENSIGTSFGKANNEYYISDTTTNDIGADLQQLVDAVPEGGVIHIGSGDYTARTTCVIDKTVHITSDGKSQHGGATTGPTIHLENADTPFIRVEGGRPSFTGLNLSCKRSGVTTNGILFHSRAVVDNCTAEGFSAVPFYFQNGDGDNLNAIRTNNVCGHNIDADLICLEQVGGARNLNACIIDVGTYTGDSSGYAINAIHGFGNTYTVQHVEGGGPIKGALRIGDNDNRGYVNYIENPQSIVEFTADAHYNTVEINYSYNVGTEAVRNGDQDSDNRIIRDGSSVVADGTRWDRSEELGGQDLLFSESGRGPVVKSPDGTVAKRITIDNSGSLTTEDLDASQF